jgi:hypothetical protein
MASACMVIRKIQAGIFSMSSEPRSEKSQQSSTGHVPRRLPLMIVAGPSRNALSERLSGQFQLPAVTSSSIWGPSTSFGETV